MTPKKERLEAVRRELLDMPATGPDGFEGLTQAVLAEVTGVPFRLSAAGSQRGRDGAVAYPHDGISFECKLYDGRLRPDSVLTKLVEFSREPDAELWILCATVPVSEQLAHGIREVGQQVGVSTHVLDWYGELPPLAVGLSLARGVLSDRLSGESIAALEALEHEGHFKWIEDALCAARAAPDSWSAISDAVSDWLGCYSCPASESASEEPAPAEGRVRFDWARISAGEESLLEGMTEVSGKVEALSRFGLRLIAGRRLAPFAKGLVQTVFANGLEKDVFSVGRDVEELVGFNRVDWRETRDALLREGAVLQMDATSRAGKWALVKLLRATGEPKDARLADRFVRELSDWDGGETWRLVEEYCASDPCDPLASSPNNLGEAVAYYDQLDMGQLHPEMGQTKADHLFSMLRPAMARFAPARAATRHRDFGRHVVAREGHALRLGLFALEAHNSILGRELASKLLTASRQNGSCGHAGEGLSDDDRWIVSEYGRLLVFPHLTSQEQLQLLPEVDDKRGSLLRLVGLAKTLDPAELERCLEEAHEAKCGGAICALLAFCRQQRVAVSERFKVRLSSLMESPEGIVRSTALGVVEYLNDTKLVARFAASDWTSADTKEAFHSDFFGSLILIRAAREKLIPWQEAVTRVSARTYGVAVERGGYQAAGMVAELIHESIRSALQRDVRPGSRRVEIGVPSRGQRAPLWARVRERTTQGEFLEGFSADPDALVERFAKQQARDRTFFERLDEAGNDHEIAFEVLAAMAAPLVRRNVCCTTSGGVLAVLRAAYEGRRCPFRALAIRLRDIERADAFVRGEHQPGDREPFQAMAQSPRKEAVRRTGSRSAISAGTSALAIRCRWHAGDGLERTAGR